MASRIVWSRIGVDPEDDRQRIRLADARLADARLADARLAERAGE